MAKVAKGVVLKRGDGVSPEVFTAIAELTTIGGPNRSRDVIDVSNQDSASFAREYLAGFLDGGEVPFEGNYLADNVTQTNLNVDFDAGTLRNFKVEITPLSPLKTWSFSAFITRLEHGYPHDGKQTISGTLKVSGKPTLA